MIFTRKEILKIREDYGLTQKQLAEKLDVSKRTVEGWESESRPKMPGRRSQNDLNRFVKEMEG